MKKKRRDSQVFNFTQTEEALEVNENLRQLYENKNFVYPEVKGLETILEEEIDDIEKEVGKQSTNLEIGVDVGKSLRKRFIKNFKSWKQIDKERILKRELMVKKMWKGRVVPKRSSDVEEKLEIMLSNVDNEVGEDGANDSALMNITKKKSPSRGKSLRKRLNEYLAQKKSLEAAKMKLKKPVFQVCVNPRAARVDHEKMKLRSKSFVERARVTRVRQKK